MDDWGSGGRGGGNYRARGSRGFGGGGGRYNDQYYSGRGGRGGGGYYEGGGGGGYYDGGPGPSRGGGRGGRGGYNDGYQGGGYQGGGYQGGGYQGGGGYDGGYQGGGGYRGGGGGGRFNDGGSRRGFRGGRSWHNPGQKRQQQYNANPPPNLSLLKTIPAHSSPITCMAYDQPTNALFTGSKDGKIKQWDCNSGQTVHEETLGGAVDAILFIQGFLFVAYVKGPNSRDLEGIINFYNTAAGKTQMIPGHRGHINQLLAANNFLFSCGQDASIRVWGMEGEAFVCKLILDKDKGGHASSIYCIEMVNGFLISGDASGCLKIWDSATGTCTQTLAAAHTGIISSVLQYGNNILTGSADGTMKVWELCSPPMPGAVVKPEPIDRYFGDDAAGSRRYRQGPGSANAILAMDGTPDAKGESIMVIAYLHDGVSVFNVDQNMALLGTLPQVEVCRAITIIPGAAIIAGDDKGQVHIFSWTG